jgi:hypothetical protein
MPVSHSDRRGLAKRTLAGSKALKVRHARVIEQFSVDEPRYLLGQVAFAAGISSTLLKAWIVRKIIPMGEHDRDAHGKGSSRVFTLRRALSIGLAAQLTRMGHAASMAGTMATGAMNYALDKAGNDALKIDDLIALYPNEDGSVSYHGAKWDYTIKTMLRRNSPLDEIPTGFLLIDLRGVAVRVLQRLGELERTI